MNTKLVQLNQKGIQAMGVLGLEPLRLKPSAMNPAFEALSQVVKVNPDGMVFLGVSITSHQVANSFIEEILRVRNLDTIIMETFITPAEVYNCNVYPISAVAGTTFLENTQATLSTAQYAEQMIRMHGDPFRIVFASSLGVMVYRSEFKYPMKKFGDQCAASYMADMVMVCTSSGWRNYTADGMSAFIVRADNITRFIVFEDSTTLTNKLQKYVKQDSDGWALYDVIFDVYWQCTSTRNNGTHFARVRDVSKTLKKIKVNSAVP
ncbi:uncharacterized protein LOC144165041 [Haemaphysalis longicornis]